MRRFLPFAALLGVALVWLPDVDPIRADPRFQAMLVEMHIGGLR